MRNYLLQTFFPSSSSCKQFSIFFSVFFLFVLNITIALFDNVPTGHHARTTWPVVPGANAGTLLI